MAARITVPNLRRERFIEAYLENGFNGRQAALTAGYSEASLDSAANHLLRDPDVVYAIEHRQSEMRERSRVTLDRIIVELSKMAFFDISKIFDENGRLRPVHLIEADARAAIAGVESEELFGGDGTLALGILRKVKIVDRVRAMELLAKLLGFSEKINVDVRLPGNAGGRHTIVFEDLTAAPDEPPITPHEEIKSLGNGDDY